MAGTISSTTKIYPVGANEVVPPGIRNQAKDFQDFAAANGVHMTPRLCTFDTQRIDQPVQYHLVYDGDGTFGCSMNVQTEYPRTADADLVDLFEFLGLGRKQPNPVWETFKNPPK